MRSVDLLAVLALGIMIYAPIGLADDATKELTWTRAEVEKLIQENLRRREQLFTLSAELERQRGNAELCFSQFPLDWRGEYASTYFRVH